MRAARGIYLEKQHSRCFVPESSSICYQIEQRASTRERVPGRQVKSAPGSWVGGHPCVLREAGKVGTDGSEKLVRGWAALLITFLLIGVASIVRSADHSDVTTFRIHFDTVILPEKKFHDVALVKSHLSDWKYENSRFLLVKVTPSFYSIPILCFTHKTIFTFFFPHCLILKLFIDMFYMSFKSLPCFVL